MPEPVKGGEEAPESATAMDTTESNPVKDAKDSAPVKEAADSASVKETTETSPVEESTEKPKEESTPTNGKTAPDQTMETDPPQGGSSVDKEELKKNPAFLELAQLIREGSICIAEKAYAEGADNFGKACELVRELYGELAIESARIYSDYGFCQLECARSENTVLGESVKEEQEKESDDSDEEETEEAGEEEEKAEPEPEPEEKGEEETKKTEDGEENLEEEEKKEDEDSPLRIAWEMFELAKVIYLKHNKEKEAADMYMKLSEVGIESGHTDAIEDMRQALAIRKKIYPQGHRIVAETHFHMGLGYSFFQMFEEAIQEFRTSKQLLELKIEELQKLETPEGAEEIKEIRSLLPDIDDKISDMVESKEEKEKAQAHQNGGGKLDDGTGAGGSKQISDISHLVKRKRKIEEVSSELAEQAPVKQVCLEEKSVEKTE